MVIKMDQFINAVQLLHSCYLLEIITYRQFLDIRNQLIKLYENGVDYK